MYGIKTRLDESLRSRDFTGLREALEKLPPAEVAHLIGELQGEQQVPVFRVLPRKTAAAAFAYLPLEKQEELLNLWGRKMSPRYSTRCRLMTAPRCSRNCRQRRPDSSYRCSMNERDPSPSTCWGTQRAASGG